MHPVAPTAPVPWHTLAVDDVMARLDSDPRGLSGKEVARRLSTCGPNRVLLAKPVSAFKILVDQLANLVVWLLVVAAAISLSLGDLVEAVAIAAVLVLNTSLGFVIDWRARRAMEALLQLDVSRCAVVRDGRVYLIDAHDLVPGDIIEIDRGQSVPADARLLTVHDLRTMEAALTGESLPVSKHEHARLTIGTSLADRKNMVYKGTTVAAGMARGVVTETGPATELGRIGRLVGTIREERTPLERRLDELGRRLVWLALAVAALVSALGFLQGASLALVIEMGIALAVAAVPEALPAVATIALAIGLRRMASRHALVRRLSAVEALGSTTVICSDKTRTLTSGDMTLVRVWTPDGVLDLTAAPSDPVSVPAFAGALRVAVLASRPRPSADEEPSSMSGDPVDAALLRGAEIAGLDCRAVVEGHPAAGFVPFSSERKLMAAFTASEGRFTAYVKGAPGRILELSDRVRVHGADRQLDDTLRNELAAVNRELAAHGLRVLGLATGSVLAAREASLHNLTFVGFVGLMDPPAPGVKNTIRSLRLAGLRTIMLTGDQRTTAEAVGRELGLVSTSDQVLDARQLREVSADALRTRLGDVAAFSRITAEDKLMVVQALQQRGEIVAMLGDGVNDAAALKKADVGVAMGLRGTDVAKEAASIVLQDDRFETIAAAVEEGRVVFDNIRKFVFYLFSCNLAEVLVLLIAGVIRLPLPLLPLQILWLNIVTDTLPALALALEPGDPDVMRRPPRAPKEAILSSGFLGSIVFYATLITASSLAGFLWALSRQPGSATTMCFMTLALAQIFHLGNARSPRAVLSPARASANRHAIGAVVVSVGLQLVALYLPIVADAIHVTPLDWTEWLVVLGLAAIPGTIGQALKAWRDARQLRHGDGSEGPVATTAQSR